MLYGSVGRVGLRALSGTSFSPLSLFAAGEQGVWLDNSDFTTLFQDAAGTTPVTGYEQFVGLRLDKSKGLVLGPELVDTINTAAAWSTFGTNTITNDDGGVKVTYVDDTRGGRAFLTAAAGLSSDLVDGKFYKITGEVKVSSGVVRLQASTSSTIVISDVSSTSYVPFSVTIVKPSGLSPFLQLAEMTTGEAAWIKNISVRELPGNHAYQTTTTARAVLSARYNLLRYTEDFSNPLWAKTQAASTVPVVTANQATAPDGTLTADRIDFGEINDAADYSVVQQTLSPTETLSYTGSIYVRAATAGDIGKKLWVYAYDTAVRGVKSVILTDSFQRVVISPTITLGTNRQILAFGTIGASYGGENQGAVSAFVWGADLRVANESSALPAYQRVGAAVNGTSTSIGTPDYGTVGFPAYLRYDGGDWYQTNSIDFSTGATNPPLGPELVTNGTFDANLTGWTAQANVTATWLSSFSGRDGVVRLVTSGNNLSFEQSISTQNGRYYVASVSAYAPSSNTDLNAAFLAAVSGVTTIAFKTVTSEDVWQTVKIVFQAISSTTLIRLGAYDGTGAGTLNETAYFDGVTVQELTDTNYLPDKMSVFTGVRKLSESGPQVAVELSTAASSNPGSFVVYNTLGTSEYAFGLNGNSWGYGSAAPFPAPITNVVSALYDIGGASDATEVAARINGLPQTLSFVADPGGTGNFGNYPLFIGSRNGSLWFNGREYETIVLGRAVTATELTNTEGYMETQTFGKDMSYVYSDELTTATGDLITAADGDQIYMSVQYI